MANLLLWGQTKDDFETFGRYRVFYFQPVVLLTLVFFLVFDTDINVQKKSKYTTVKYIKRN